MSRDLPVPQHSLDQYMLEVGRIPLLTRQEEAELAQKLTGDDREAAREAARQLVASNLRFVVKVAFEYKNYNIRMTDLVQEGNVGLMHAVSKFDPDRGYRLISYAVWWIKAYIQNFIIKNWSMVPVHARRKMLFGKRKQLPSGEIVVDGDGESGDGQNHYLIEAEPRHPEIPGITQAEIALARRDFSLDASVGEEGTSTHLMRLPATGPSAEDEMGREQVRQAVHHALQGVIESLDERGVYILQNRLLADEPMSLAAIGAHYGISRERARQLEKRVKTKVKAALEHLGAAEITIAE